MAISARMTADGSEEPALLARARDADCRLMQRELATGELVWEHGRGSAHGARSGGAVAAGDAPSRMRAPTAVLACIIEVDGR